MTDDTTHENKNNNIFFISPTIRSIAIVKKSKPQREPDILQGFAFTMLKILQGRRFSRRIIRLQRKTSGSTNLSQNGTDYSRLLQHLQRRGSSYFLHNIKAHLSAYSPAADAGLSSTNSASTYTLTSSTLSDLESHLYLFSKMNTGFEIVVLCPTVFVESGQATTNYRIEHSATASCRHIDS
jgi:hypothetical protein